MMRGKRENFFSREKKPNVGFVILFPLSRHSLGDGGSHPFKKSEKTFLPFEEEKEGFYQTYKSDYDKYNQKEELISDEVINWLRDEAIEYNKKTYPTHMESLSCDLF